MWPPGTATRSITIRTIIKAMSFSKWNETNARGSTFVTAARMRALSDAGDGTAHLWHKNAFAPRRCSSAGSLIRQQEMLCNLRPHDPAQRCIVAGADLPVKLGGNVPEYV